MDKGLLTLVLLPPGGLPGDEVFVKVEIGPNDMAAEPVDFIARIGRPALMALIQQLPTPK